MKNKIRAPQRANLIPENAQWLGGVGAGSWFLLRKEEKYKISRYSEDGDLECESFFEVKASDFQFNQPFEFTYLSHCNQCTIIQNNVKYLFKRLENED